MWAIFLRLTTSKLSLSIVGDLPMTHDLKVILKYSRGSSYGWRPGLDAGLPLEMALDPPLAVLGLSRGLCERSRSALVASLGGLGRSWGPRCGQEQPKSSQELPKSAPKSRQEPPRAAKNEPRAAPERPRAAQERPRAPQDGPRAAKSSQERPKTAPNGPKSGLSRVCP